jgi:putative ABC transport system substrate-binding protein
MIDRRALAAGVGAALLAPPARAQQPARLPVVGLVLPNVPPAEMAGADPVSPLVRGFVQGLREQGWIEGRTVVIERRSAAGQPDRAPALVAELVARGVDVLAVGGARWLHEAARQATRTIPIVAIFPSDPVIDGQIASLARPGGNLTGVTYATGPEFAGKQVQLLREFAPAITRVAFLAVRTVLDQYRAMPHDGGPTIIPVPVEAAGEYDQAFALIRRERADALMAAGGPPNVVNARRIASFATESRLPAIFGFREAADAGGLMSYGPSFVGVFRQKARLVARFLGGAKPGEVPTEQPATFELVLNLKAAKALGLAVPPAILIRADEVIE